jgi:ketosteroid isomerase-like protein
MEITAEEVSRAHREDFYGALKENDFEKLAKIYSDDYMLVRPVQDANPGRS